MLYIVSTPIGNLQDITLRALEVLKSVDLILCEDTRTSGTLLSHYAITTPLSSFHRHNETAKLDSLLRQMQEGSSIALISDAGTPLIHDPGQALVQKAFDHSLPVTPIPGACAITAALPLIGKPWKKFQFLGFPSEKLSLRTKNWEKALRYEGMSMFYIAPHDLAKYLKEIEAVGSEAPLILLREMTKKFEERLFGTPSQLHAITETRSLKGEMVLVIEGRPAPSFPEGARETMELLTKEGGLKPTLASKLTAKLTGASRNELYRWWSGG